MDLGWLSRLDGEWVTFQALHGDGPSFGMGPQTTVRVDEYREDRLDRRVLTGELPSIIPDTRADPRTAGMLAVRHAGIGAFAAAPVHDDDGLHGLVGCLGRTARPGLGARHAQTLDLVAKLLSVPARDLDGMWQRGSRVLRALRQILDGGGPRVVYQPLVDPRSGETVGLEALARFPRRPARSGGSRRRRPSGSGSSWSCRSCARWALGVLIAVDDVGSGYAGLRRLTHLRPEVIKVDRCLIQGIDADPVRRAAAIAVIRSGQAIGSRVVAEGIETAPGLAAVLDTGITYGQGFYLARPAATLPTFLTRPTRRAP